MLSLIGQLARKNLVKNRSLYYPFALATTASVAILYLFISLWLNPDLTNLRGGNSIQTVMTLGVFVVTIAIAAIVNYANGFVMKNRTKELGLYEILGLNKGHLVCMMGIELTIFATLNILLGIGFGMALDQLIYALLLKIISWKVSLVATFQWSNVLMTGLICVLIFAFAGFLNLIKLLRLNALELNRESRKGEKTSRFVLPQTILGLILLGAGYYMALTVKSPSEALVLFFLATLLVILATYLLFNAGVTTFLKLMKKRKSFYQPKNFIALSNLIFRMKKNAMGLATIAILSTMVLVTLVGGVNIFTGTEEFISTTYPHELSISVMDASNTNQTADSVLADLKGFTDSQGISTKNEGAYRFVQGGLEKATGQQLELYDASSVGAPGAFLTMIDEQDYAEMTGNSVDLSAQEVLVYSNQASYKAGQTLALENKEFHIKDVLDSNIISKKLGDSGIGTFFGTVILVVDTIDEAQAGLAVGEMDRTQTTSLSTSIYVGLDTNLSEDEQSALAPAFAAFVTEKNNTLESGYLLSQVKADDAIEVRGLMGSVFFIGIFLAIVFMMGTVLVIYYKQISEGYEDKENFVILQKVGLDKQQTNQTIRKQVLTVFFLPLLFTFMHMAAAFHMVRLVINAIVPVQFSSVLMVTLAVSLIFALVYMAVFAVTSRSYAKIVAR